MQTKGMSVLLIITFLLPLLPLNRGQALLTVAEEPSSELVAYRTVPFYLGGSGTYFDPDMPLLDLNHDGVQDLVFVQQNPDYFIAMNTSGETYWTIPFTEEYLFSGDFDRDGYLDDIISYVPFLYSTFPKAWNESGERIFTDKNNTINYAPCPVNDVIADFNGDGYFDDFSFGFVNATGNYYSASNFLSRKSLWNISLNDELVVTRLPCDLTNAGLLDTIFLDTTGNMSFAVGRNGSSLWTFQGGGWRDGMSRPACIGDIDHDNYEDDIILISPWNNSLFALDNSGSVLWNFSSNSAIFVEACDYDNDNFKDEVCVLESTKLLVLDELGSIIFQVSLNETFQVLMSDVNKDGLLDFLISGMHLVIINHSGTFLGVGGYGSHTPITVADFNGDKVAKE